MPDTRYQIPDTRYQIPDTRYRYQIPDARYQIPDTRYSKYLASRLTHVTMWYCKTFEPVLEDSVKNNLSERISLLIRKNCCTRISTEKNCPFEDIVEMGKSPKMVVMLISDSGS
jgi:hypothetical protein